MEVSARHAATGECCVVSVEGDDTVESLRQRVLHEMLCLQSQAVRRRAAAVLGLRMAGPQLGAEPLGGPDTPLCHTPLCAGGEVELVAGQADVRADVAYPCRAYAVSLSPCDRRVAFAEQACVSLWDTETCTRLWAAKEPTAPRVSVQCSPCGRWVASVRGGVSLRSAATGELRFRVQAGLRANAAAFTCCGSLLAAGGDDRSLRVWDVGTGACLHVLPGHTAWVSGIAATDTALLSASGDRTVRVWSLGGDVPRCTHVLKHTGAVFYLAVSGGGGVVVTASRKSLRLWRAGEWVCTGVVALHGYDTPHVAIPGCDAFIATRAYGQGTQYRDVTTGEPIGPASEVEGSTGVFAVTHCGQWVFECVRGAVCVAPVPYPLTSLPD